MQGRAHITTAAAILGVGIAVLIWTWSPTDGEPTPTSSAPLSTSAPVPAIAVEATAAKLDGEATAFDESAGLLRDSIASPQGASSNAESSLWSANAPEFPDYHILRRLVFSPWLVGVPDITHSVVLNPRQLPIPDTDYKPLARMLQHYVDHFHALLQFRGQLRMVEMLALEKAGALLDNPTEAQIHAKRDEIAHRMIRETGRPETDELLAEVRAKLDARVAQRGPVAVGFVEHRRGKESPKYYPSDQLTERRQVTEYARFRGQELAFFIVEYFHRNGYLAVDEYQACLTQIQNLINSRR